jgi:hypothetical protein
MLVRATPKQWLDCVFYPRFESFKKAADSIAFSESIGAEPSYDKGLVDFSGLGLCHDIHDALSQARRYGEEFSQEELFQIADKLYRAHLTAREISLPYAEQGLPYWIDFVCEKVGNKEWQTTDRLVIGKLSWTTRGAHAGPNFAEFDWAVGKLVMGQDELFVHVADSDGLRDLRTPREFKISLAHTLEAQKSDDGLKSAVQKILASGARVLSGLEELGVSKGKLVHLNLVD